MGWKVGRDKDTSYAAGLFFGHSPTYLHLTFGALGLTTATQMPLTRGARLDEPRDLEHLQLGSTCCFLHGWRPLGLRVRSLACSGLKNHKRGWGICHAEITEAFPTLVTPYPKIPQSLIRASEVRRNALDASIYRSLLPVFKTAFVPHRCISFEWSAQDIPSALNSTLTPKPLCKH